MITAKRLRELLNYDPKTGIFRWRVDRRGRCAKKDKIAGTIRNGYRYIYLDGHWYRGARLAVLYVKGRWPRQIVDHCNLVRNDDRWVNLREATHSQNHANGNARNTKWKLKGVSWDKRRAVFTAQITYRQKLIHLGDFKTPQAAHASYVAAAQKYFGVFARAK